MIHCKQIWRTFESFPPASKRQDSQLISRSFALLVHLFKVAGLERLMWARAAVALRNINICEMPSHDAYLGVGLGQGEQGAHTLRGLAILLCTQVWLYPVGVVCPLVFHRCQAWMLLGSMLSMCMVFRAVLLLLQSTANCMLVAPRLPCDL